MPKSDFGLFRVFLSVIESDPEYIWFFGWLLVRMREFPNSNMKCEFNALLPRGGREVSVTYSAPVKGE